MNQYVFNYKNNFSTQGITDSLLKLYQTPYPVIICIGSDLVVGDSLGPFIGTQLSNRLKNVYVYGTLQNPITAKETLTIKNTIKLIHPKSKILVIDAAVGEETDVGLIKVTDKGIKPGLGINKDLDVLGDVSIIGIVAKKETPPNNLFYQTRFSLVYNISQTIIQGVVNYFK